jgi:DeoR/GlpR family transcriptional regulator of sugar metabolism
MNKTAQRHRKILEQLEERGSVNVSELSASLNVSEMTVRRDLNELGNVGLLRRIHGGASSSRNRAFEPPLPVRRTKNMLVKKILGKYASKMVAEGDSIALDVGSTIYEVAASLKETRNITIVTPSIQIANLFCDRSDVRLILPGGVVRPGETSLVGDLARKTLESLFVDRLFLGVGAVDTKSGLTEYNMEDTAIKQTMIANSMEVVLVADSSKFQRVAFTFVAPFKAIHHVVTDADSPEEVLSAFKDAGATVHVISVPAELTLPSSDFSDTSTNFSVDTY